MDENTIPNQFISGDAKVSANPQYLQWIESVKGRYRQSQIKAHLQVNAAVLEFNWYLGHDICEIMRTRIWGSGVINQVSLDLKAAFPEAQGFSRANLYRMGRFYSFYAEQKEIVAQVVQQLQPAENKENTIVAQVVRQIKGTLVINVDSAPVMAFPAFLGMIPWGHNIEIFEGCKSVKEAVFYIERTIQNNWSRINENENEKWRKLGTLEIIRSGRMRWNIVRRYTSRPTRCLGSRRKAFATNFSVLRSASVAI